MFIFKDEDGNNVIPSLFTRKEGTEAMLTLSKSDFKLGLDCPTKLYYKKQGYASKLGEDDYLQFLAEGGYLIGAVATLVEPGGTDVAAEVRRMGLGTSWEATERALALTRSLLKGARVTLYEPAFLVGRRLVRVDVLVKDGSNIDLIEVKSKSQDGANPEWKGGDWREHLDDLAYQTLVVRAALPGFTVRPWLMTPDKSVRAEMDHLTTHFRLREHESHGSFRDLEVEYHGGPELAEEIRTSGLLRRWDVERLVEERLSDVEASARGLEQWLTTDPLLHPRTRICKNCFKCEYDHATEAAPTNGFRECWGERARPERHVRHLYKVGTIRGKDEPNVDKWIRRGLVNQDDLREEHLKNASGTLTATAKRALKQIECTRSGTEWINERVLRKHLEAWPYPLHFLDFEASASPLPYHRGMRPYQTVVFQWSCHTVEAPGAEPLHKEFLNTEAVMPAQGFLRALRKTIGDDGTPLMWSHYENTQLRSLLEWLQTQEPDTEADLLAWLDGLVTVRKNNKVIKKGRLVDQHALVPKAWFHPKMGGRTSLKVCLPAALEASASPRIDRWLEAEGLLDPVTGGRPEDPYKLLPDLLPGVVQDEDPEERPAADVSITDGVEAMRAYQDMVYGLHMNDAAWRARTTEALRRYCRLDTLAQVIVWEHWRTRLGLEP